MEGNGRRFLEWFLPHWGRGMQTAVLAEKDGGTQNPCYQTAFPWLTWDFTLTVIKQNILLA